MARTWTHKRVVFEGELGNDGSGRGFSLYQRKDAYQHGLSELLAKEDFAHNDRVRITVELLQKQEDEDG